MKKEEYCKKNLKDRKVFYYLNEKEGINVICRETYKKKKLEIHYPFAKDGKQKYKYIRSIEFQDIDPRTINGVYKAISYGLGLTKNLSPIIYKLESIPTIGKIIISPKLKSQISKVSITFNTTDLEEIFQIIKPFKEIQGDELKKLANNTLNNIFPTKIPRIADEYHKDELFFYLENKKAKSSDLSDKDINKLIEILPDEIKEEKILYKAEEKINFIKLKKVKDDFEKLINQVTESEAYEKRCQDFFTKNSWILSNILSMPVVSMGQKIYVGGTNITNKGGREADFLFKNNLTKNVFILEIKTPLKKLIDSSTPYRSPDRFSMGKELTGGIVQVLDQKDNLQKAFYSLVHGADFKSFNPKSVLIIGRISNLSEEQIKSFELFRSNLKDVEVITYDELLDRTNLILGEFISGKKIS